MRASSPATRSNARSHDTGTNGSRPRPSPNPRECPRPCFSQPSRTIGCAMRVCECTAAGTAWIIGEGSGSCSKGRTPTTRPSSTSARKAPQWAWLRMSLVMGRAFAYIGSHLAFTPGSSSSLIDHGHDLDLDQKAGIRQPANLDDSAPRQLVRIPISFCHFRISRHRKILVHVEDERSAMYDIVQCRPCRREPRLDAIHHCHVLTLVISRVDAFVVHV